MAADRPGRFGRLVAALLAVSFLATLSPVAAVPDDEVQVLRKLRAEQLEYLELASRNGIARLISYEPARVLAIRSRPRPAHGRSSRIANVKRVSAPPRVAAVVLPPKPVAFVRPPSTRNVVTPPRVVALVSRPLASASGVFVNYGRTFVPTTTVVKPAVRPAPAPDVRDLAWEFAHRFDAPGADGMEAPGVPVRSQVGSPFDIRSGPFHGVRSLNGYSAIRARVSIPCGAAHFATGEGYNEVTKRNGIVDQETGFIYIGGWGAGPHGVSVDAGLQKASAQAEADDYAFYFKYANNHPITLPIRFPCGGPDPVLELYPITNALLVFSITGVTDQHRSTTLTLVQQTKPEDGWSPDGGSPTDGIILKRVVAIAQPPQWRNFFGLFHRDRFSNGSYFGVNGPADNTPRIVWRSCEIGRVPPSAKQADYHDWDDTATWHPATPGVYLDWPPADVTRNTDGVCDTVGIFLRRS